MKKSEEYKRELETIITKWNKERKKKMDDENKDAYSLSTYGWYISGAMDEGHAKIIFFLCSQGKFEKASQVCFEYHKESIMQ